MGSTVRPAPEDRVTYRVTFGGPQWQSRDPPIPVATPAAAMPHYRRTRRRPDDLCWFSDQTGVRPSG